MEKFHRVSPDTVQFVKRYFLYDNMIRLRQKIEGMITIVPTFSGSSKQKRQLRMKIQQM
jgi:hypothetical protein